MSTVTQKLSSAGKDDRHSLDNLVQRIRTYLGQQSGIDSEEVEVATLKSFLDDYVPASEDEWRKFGSPEPGKAYTRLLVDSINHRSNLLFLVWSPGKGSPIHDHANAHCVMKVLRGSLNETIYELPEPSTGRSSLRVKKSTDHRNGQTTYISDEIGLHAITNNSHDDFAISIHLYTPPNAADFGYNIYDPSTGRSSHVAGARVVKKDTSV